MNAPFQPGPIVPILADVGISIVDLQRDPAAAIATAGQQQVAIIDGNRPVAYLVSPEMWDHVVDVFDDRKLIADAQDAFGRFERGEDRPVAVSIDDLLA